jgi:hypothetical protein
LSLIVILDLNWVEGVFGVSWKMAFGQEVSYFVATPVEQANLDLGGIGRKKGEVSPFAVPGRAQGIRQTFLYRFDRHESPRKRLRWSAQATTATVPFCCRAPANFASAPR